MTLEELANLVASNAVRFVQLFPGDHTEAQPLRLDSVQVEDGVLTVALVGDGE